ncbi:hypothetical protein [Alloyangia pacifica]|uniref:Uncharacterized protein n=1 Tax=Alloyangia pacifica TaxID=311180 RepID=A0A1I6T1D3_9RHOB|nr:hypothetical protein [Alloyangia pacifica]SDG93570.1 hypothetical protein SAMN04488245_105199 [Alloyangia pacifica]SFS82827.1 hypothetical protein SAMN04488050_105199 [Alloyangia pacifica]
MNVHALTRKEKRALSAKGAKLYGIGGDAAVALFQAYQCLKAGNLAEACQHVLPLTKSAPENPHAWIVLGLAALNRREGQTAKAFFGKAAENAPGSVEVITGLAKAHFLCAEPAEAVAKMEEAFKAGNTEVELMLLYLSLMDLYEKVPAAAKFLEPFVSKVKNVELNRQFGLKLAEYEDHKTAAVWLERAFAQGPDTELGKLCGANACFQRGEMAEAEARARELLAGDLQDRDDAMMTLIGALRFQSKHDEVISLVESHDFDNPTHFGRARAFAANAYHDLGKLTEARHAYLEAMHAAGEARAIGRAYGAFCFGHGDYAEGVPNYLQRLPEKFRSMVPLESSEPENLRRQSRIFIMSEQGVGDQLALLPLVRLLPEVADREVVFMADPREADLLQDNTLGLSAISKSELATLGYSVSKEQIVALGDLVRFLPDHPPDARHGGYLAPKAGAVAEIRARYEGLAAGRPIFGMAWAARALIGTLRSVELSEMVRILPPEAFVVSLQYGDTDAEIAAARQARPDVVFHCDPHVDQMADLAAFAAQCAALDRIVTIDNTTAHMCGALGHPDTHMLVPAGAECMWYWGGEGTRDPWYGALHLHRQAAVGDWRAALDSVREVVAG